MNTCFDVRPWRCGRKVGRTIYAQIGDAPTDDDVLIGVMDTRELASLVVDGHNNGLKRHSSEQLVGEDK